LKIIHIAGWSGSGKTTFVVQLCSHLALIGKTATIKHMGSHYSTLPLGKDTTLHFESRADPAIGIDNEKTSACFHGTSLEEALDLLSDRGVRYAVLEGFKRWPFQKIVFGDLDGAHLFKNPDLHDVLASLDRFDDWYTLAGLVKEVSDHPTPHTGVYTWTGYTAAYQKAKNLCAELEHAYQTDPRIMGIRIRTQPWSPDDRYPIYVVLAMHPAYHGQPLLSELIEQITPCIAP